MKNQKKWKYRFEEDGGYDCLSSAYVISENGKDRFTLDRFGFTEDGKDYSYDELHSRNQEMKDLAQKIVKALNKED